MKIRPLYCLLLFSCWSSHASISAQEVAIVDLDSIYWILWEPAEQIRTREQYEIRLQAYQNELDTISSRFQQLYEQLINAPSRKKGGPHLTAAAWPSTNKQVTVQLVKKIEELRQQQKAVLLQELTQANREQYKLVVEKSSILYLAEDEFSVGSAPLQFSKRMIALMTEEQLEKLVPCQKLRPKY